MANKYKRVNSGIPGLDEIFSGGIVENSITLLAGHSGTGKTMFGLQFLKEGLLSGEKCIFISLGKNPLRILDSYDVLDIRWKKYIGQGKFILHSAKLSSLADAVLVLEIILNKEDKFRIVIDEFPAKLNTEDNGELLEAVNNIVENTINFNVTAVFISGVFEEEKYFGLAATALAPIADNIIVIKQSAVNNNIVKLLTVLKSKATLCDKKISELRVGAAGLELREAGAAAHVEINVYIPFGKLIVQCIREFEEKYPSIAVYRTQKPAKTMRKIDTPSSKEPAGGVISLGYNEVFKYSQEGLLLDLEEDYIAEDDYIKEALEACYYDGKLYGIPEDVYCKSLIYRKDLLEKYKRKVPETWDELVETSGYILKKEKNSELNGLLFFCGDGAQLADSFVEFVWSNGGSIFDKEGNVTFTGKELEALKFMKDLIYKYKIMPENSYLYEDWDIIKKFCAGKVIFLKFMPYIMKEFQGKGAALENKVGLAPLPGMKKEEKGYGVLSGQALAIHKNTKFPQEANKFLKYFLDSGVLKNVELESGYPFPAKISILKSKEILAKKPYYAACDSLFENCKNKYKEIMNYDLISLLIKKKILPVIKGEVEPENALEALAGEIKKVKRHKIYNKIAENTISYLEKNFDKKISLDDVAAAMRYSTGYLVRVFNFETGMSIFDYLINIRMEKAKKLLEDIQYNVNEVAIKVGYTDVSYFCKIFKKHTNSTPGEYRLRKL